MSERLFVATRKGLLTLTRSGTRAHWRIGAPRFLGDPVTMVLPDARDGVLYAALNLGHFGVKLRHSRNQGESWDCVSSQLPPIYCVRFG